MSADNDDPNNANDEPQVFSIKKVDGRWSLGRRDLLKAGGAGAAAGAALGAGVAGAQSANVIYAHAAGVEGVAVLGQRLVSWGADGRIKLWALPECTLAANQNFAESAPSDVAWDPQGRYIVAADSARIVFFSPDLSRTLAELEHPASCLAVSPSGDEVAAYSYPTMRYIAVTPGETFAAVKSAEVNLEFMVGQMAYSPRDGRIWCAGGEGLRVIAPGAEPRPVQIGAANGSTIVIAAHLNIAATSEVGNYLRFIDLAHLQNVGRNLPSGQKPAFGANSDLFAVTGEGNDVFLYRLSGDGAAPAQVFRGDAHTSTVNALAFAADLKYVYSASDDRSIIQWDAATGAIAQRFLDLSASPRDAEGVRFEVRTGNVTQSFTQPCGSPIPAGAVCTCNCVGGTWRPPPPPPSTATYSYHYWYPN